MLNYFESIIIKFILLGIVYKRSAVIEITCDLQNHRKRKVKNTQFLEKNHEKYGCY